MKILAYTKFYWYGFTTSYSTTTTTTTNTTITPIYMFSICVYKYIT